MAYFDTHFFKITKNIFEEGTPLFNTFFALK